MAITPSDSGHGVLSTSATTIMDTSAAKQQRVTKCSFYNADSASRTVTVYYLRDGETAGDNGTYLAKKTVPPSKSWICQEAVPQVVETNGKLQALADAANVVHYNVSTDVIS